MQKPQSTLSTRVFQTQLRSEDTNPLTPEDTGCSAADSSLDTYPGSSRLPGSECPHLPSGLCFWRHKPWVLPHQEFH